MSLINNLQYPQAHHKPDIQYYQTEIFQITLETVKEHDVERCCLEHSYLPRCDYLRWVALDPTKPLQECNS